MSVKKDESLQAMMRRLHVEAAPLDEQARAALADALSRSSRPLVQSWWHGDDLREACTQMNAALAAHGLAIEFELQTLQRWIAPLIETLDEEQLRRHQLGLLAIEANRALEESGSDARFRCFHRTLAWESEEPPWLRVDPAEHATLRALFGGPRDGGLEAAYDGVMRLEDVPLDITPDPAPLLPEHAVNTAREALRDGRYEEAVAAAEIGIADRSHGVLAELVRIEALHHLGRTADARATWVATADGWLRGERTVWDTQWAALERLHGLLDLPDDALEERVRARAPRPS